MALVPNRQLFELLTSLLTHTHIRNQDLRVLLILLIDPPHTCLRWSEVRIHYTYSSRTLVDVHSSRQQIVGFTNDLDALWYQYD